MIDTVSLVGVLEMLQDERYTVEELQGDWTRVSRRGARGGWEAVYRCTIEGVTITVSLATGQMDIRLSVPRDVHSQRDGYDVNYPLVPFDELDVEYLAHTIAMALGCPEPQLEVMARSLSLRLLHDFGVRSVAFAADVCCSVEDVLAILSRVRLRHPCQTWSKAVTTGLQYQGSQRRLMFYDKGEELVSKPALLRAKDEAHIQWRRRIAQLAQDYLRVEVTFKGAGQVRNLVGLEGGLLPTLAWIGTSEVGAFALTKEAASLGLLDVVNLDLIQLDSTCAARSLHCPSVDVHDQCVPHTSLSDLVPQTGGDFIELCRLIARLSDDVPGGRAKDGPAKGTRILQAAAFAWAAKRMSKEKLIEELRMSESTIRDNVKFLNALGLRSLASDGLEPVRRLRSFSESLFDLIGGPVTSFSEPRRSREGELPPEVVPAPWGEPPEYEADAGVDLVDEDPDDEWRELA